MSDKTERKMGPSTKFVVDMGPITAFFAGYYFGDIIQATGILMAATVISLIFSYAIERKVALAPLITGVMVGVFGALTLLTEDEYFIKIKPTIANLCLAAVLLAGWAMKKPLLKYVFEVAFKLTHEGWLKLSLRWGLFFVFLAVVNEIVWRNFSTEFWVNFKLFGMLTMNIAFWVGHVNFLKRHMVEDAETPN